MQGIKKSYLYMFGSVAFLIFISCKTNTEPIDTRQYQYKLAYWVVEKLYIANPDGSSKEHLASLEMQYINFGWIPYQDRIYYGYFLPNTNDWQLVTVDINSKETQIINHQFPKAVYFRWSPDGQKVAFSAQFDDKNDIYISNFDGTDLQRITHDDIEEGFPVWSPDGSMIAYAARYSSHSPYLGKIFFFNIDGSNFTQMDVFDGKDIGEVSWSRDGNSFYFSADHTLENDDSTDTEIFTINIDGSNLKQLTVNSFRDQALSISPDGEKILFSSTRYDHVWKIFLMDLNGENQKQIGTGIGPKWSPDGSYISYQSSVPNVRVITFEGEEVTVLDGAVNLHWSYHKIQDRRN